MINIDMNLEMIEENYNDFKNKILINQSFYNLNNKKNSLMTTLSNDASILTNHFYAYKVLIEQYTNNELIEEYFNKFEK